MGIEGYVIQMRFGLVISCRITPLANPTYGEWCSYCLVVAKC